MTFAIHRQTIFPVLLATIVATAGTTSSPYSVAQTTGETLSSNSSTASAEHSPAAADKRRHGCKHNNKGAKKSRHWNRLAQKLGLQDSQETAFIEAMEQQHAQRIVAREQSGLKQAMDGIDQQLEITMASILSQDQLTLFLDHQQQHRERRQKHRSER